MKKIALITLLVLACAPMMRAQENKVRVPSGYQGFLEQGNSFRVADKFSSAISLSTTHGFYFGQHTFVGIGIGVEGNNDFTVVPVYTALKYNFKIGGIDNYDNQMYILRFVHAIDSTHNIRVTVVGNNTAGFELQFQPDAETVLNAEFECVPGVGSSGVLIIYTEDDDDVVVTP